jgi:protein subunit release factor B
MTKPIPEISINELRFNSWNPIRTGFVMRQDTHVSIAHLPTGIHVEASDERSIHRASAVAVEKFEKAWIEYWSKLPMNSKEAFEAWFHDTQVENSCHPTVMATYEAGKELMFAAYQAGLASQTKRVAELESKLQSTNFKGNSNDHSR